MEKLVHKRGGSSMFRPRLHMLLHNNNSRMALLDHF